MLRCLRSFSFFTKITTEKLKIVTDIENHEFIRRYCRRSYRDQINRNRPVQRSYQDSGYTVIQITFFVS